MKPIIIGLTGEAHHGKDTSADYLVQKLYINNRVIKVGIADRVKIISRELIRLFYGLDIPIEDFYDQQKKEMIHPEYPKFDGQPFTLRNVMQKIGTDVIRSNMWDTIWCDYVFKNYITTGLYHMIIISDLRFPDELTYFQNLEKSQIIGDLITCRIVRHLKENTLSIESQKHQSERYASTLPVQFEIMNDGTFEELYAMLDTTILKKIQKNLSV